VTGKPITQVEVEQGIARALQTIAELVDELASAGDLAAETEVAYKTEFSKARLSYRVLHEKATVGAVDDHATEACADLLLAYKIAENRLTTQRESLRAAQARLDGLRSLLTSVRVATN
jgi:methyl-accepting chemotaxis protein